MGDGLDIGQPERIDHCEDVVGEALPPQVVVLLRRVAVPPEVECEVAPFRELLGDRPPDAAMEPGGVAEQQRPSVGVAAQFVEREFDAVGRGHGGHRVILSAAGTVGRT